MLLLCALLLQSVQPFDPSKCVLTSISGAQDEPVKTFRVNLSQEPSERWNEIADEYRNELRTIVKDFLDYIFTNVNINNQTRIMFEKLTDQYVLEDFPEPYKSEIMGIAKRVGIHESYILFANIFYEAYSFCTSIVAYDSKSEKTFHSRNLDFGAMLGVDVDEKLWTVTKNLRRMIVSVEFYEDENSERPLFTSVNFVGSVGVLTGAGRHFSLSINERFAINGGYMGMLEWILGVNRKQEFITLLARDVLTNCKSYECAKEALSSNNLVAPVYYILGGTGGRGSVITRLRTSGPIDVWDLEDVDEHGGMRILVQTNFDRWKQQPIYDDRITPAKTCLRSLSKLNLSREDVLYSTLSTYPVLNAYTVHSTIMWTDKGEVLSYIRNSTIDTISYD